MSPKSLTSALVLSLLFSSAVLGLPVTDATTKTPALGAQGTTVHFPFVLAVQDIDRFVRW
jgi:hypothetical protein